MNDQGDMDMSQAPTWLMAVLAILSALGSLRWLGPVLVKLLRKRGEEEWLKHHQELRDALVKASREYMEEVAFYEERVRELRGENSAYEERVQELLGEIRRLKGLGDRGREGASGVDRAGAAGFGDGVSVGRNDGGGPKGGGK